MKKNMKTIVFTLSAVAAMCLTACSGGNPLEKQSPNEVEKFLKEASASSELKMNFQLSERQGVMYDACMLGRMSDQPDFCPTLYKNMVAYAHDTNGPFSSITLAELKDQTIYDERNGQPSKFGSMS